MNFAKHGGYAYPSGIMDNYGVHITEAIHEGMTLRDYFAAKAMQGLLAHPASDQHENRELVSQAYHLADAMLEVRKS